MTFTGSQNQFGKVFFFYTGVVVVLTFDNHKVSKHLTILNSIIKM